jgi:sodium/hydrogen antiporter
MRCFSSGSRIAGLVIAARRLPAWLALAAVTPGLRAREMIFAGWFGPVGIAALYYALLAEKLTGLEMLWPVTSLMICVSVIPHGITATPFSRLLGRRERQRKMRKR